MSSRCFTNEFPEFSSSISSFKEDAGKLRLNQDLQDEVRSNAIKLLNVLESNLSTHLDWKDISVYTGTSGYALLYFRLSEIYPNNNYLEKSLNIIEKSLKCLRGKRISFLCGDAGPLAIAAVIYNKLNQISQMEFCIKNLLKLKGEVLDIESELPDELLYGRAGYLFAILLVKFKTNSSLIATDFIRSIIGAILESGRNLSKIRKLKSPLAYEWHGKNYYGAAHGIAGILTLLLQIHDRLTTPELKDVIRPTIDELATHLFPSGNLPSSEGSATDRLVHWCHGAPGAIFLFGYAFKVFGDDHYLTMAKNCAKVIWQRGLLRKGYGLCHGTAGNGYAFLFMYQITRDPKFLYMATKFAEWCQNFGTHGCDAPDRPYSLFEGFAGTIYFLAEFSDVEQAKFPAFIL